MPIHGDCDIRTRLTQKQLSFTTHYTTNLNLKFNLRRRIYKIQIRKSYLECVFRGDCDIFAVSLLFRYFYVITDLEAA